MGNKEWLAKRGPVWAAIIGANVRAAREKAGLTQTELGKRAKMVYSVVSRLESGTHFPSLASFLAIAEALGVEPSTLLKKPTRTRSASS